MPFSSPAQPRLLLSNDLIFKRVFALHPRLLADLINAVRHDQPPITVLEILNPEILPEDLDGKLIVLDVLARNEHGEVFNVEVQVRHYAHWPNRGVYYVARALGGQLKEGEDYERLKPAIGISLLVSDLFPEHPDQACWHFTLRDDKRTHVQLGQALEMHIIELKKAERLRGLPPELTAWVASLLHSPEETVMSQITHPPVQEALQHMQDMFRDRELRHQALRREMALMDERVALREARKSGLEEGLEQGRAQGKVEGLTEGKTTLLLQQLTRKFGPLPTAAQQRVASASGEDLDAWALNVLGATTLEDVFLQGS
jgi:predicted transposase/invertase (TIGR01784 family)